MEYTEQSILRHLSKFGVQVTGRVIEVKRGTVGNGLLGKLDYLQNKHGYRVVFK